MASTATEWLMENPGDVEALSESFVGIEDFPIRMWTEMPLWMKEEVANQLTATFSEPYWDDIAQTTGNDAQRILREGLADGWSVQRMAGQLRESLGGDDYARTRARSIARTESGHVLNAARQAASERVKNDLPMLKIRREWISQLSATTRADHAELDGVPEDVDGTWDLAGYKIPWPAHTSLPPGQRINCGCTTVENFGMGEEESQELINQYYERRVESGEFEEETER